MESEKKYDERFKSINGLKWLPWVGKNYDKTGVLIIAESHYGGETEFEADGSDNTDEDFTREAFVKRHADGVNMWKMPNNLMRAVWQGDCSVGNRKIFWENVAFYNHVQKLMELATWQRPSDEDFRNGWDVFPEVVKILKPDYCLFVGLQAFKSFGDKMQEKGLSFEGKGFEKINRVWPRRYTLTVDGHKTEITGIKHTSRYFSWKKWYDFLSNKNNNWTEPLERCRSKPQ